MRVEHVIDDLDRKSEAAETVRFGFSGKRYEIDLTAKHAEAMRATLAPWATAARRLTPNRPARRVGVAGAPLKAIPAAPPAPSSAEVRAWARAHGRTVRDHGRLPRSLVADFQREHAR